MDDVVADMIDDQSASSDTSLPNTSPAPGAAIGSQPILLPSQLRMISSLNRLPQMRKHFAFIYPSVNSHATIIARDVKRFEFHRKGEGVLRHLADHFELE